LSTGFINVDSSDDPVHLLRAFFPDLWSDLLKRAYPDTPGSMYFAFADLLVERRRDSGLWSRAYRFFDQIADFRDSMAHDVLKEAFDRLWDSETRDQVQNHLGSAARSLFQRSSP
jgi:hypothetical protein